MRWWRMRPGCGSGARRSGPPQDPGKIAVRFLARAIPNHRSSSWYVCDSYGCSEHETSGMHSYAVTTPGGDNNPSRSTPQHLAVRVAAVHAGDADGPGPRTQPYPGSASWRNELFASLAVYHAHLVRHPYAIPGAHAPRRLRVPLSDGSVSCGDGQPYHADHPGQRLCPQAALQG